MVIIANAICRDIGVFYLIAYWDNYVNCKEQRIIIIIIIIIISSSSNSSSSNVTYALSVDFLRLLMSQI
jgi:hypothetical protein